MFFVLIIGVDIITDPAGLIATALSETNKTEENEQNLLE